MRTATLVGRGQVGPVGILELPLPDPPHGGSEWIDAYRHWAT